MLLNPGCEGSGKRKAGPVVGRPAGGCGHRLKSDVGCGAADGKSLVILLAFQSRLARTHKQARPHLRLAELP